MGCHTPKFYLSLSMLRVPLATSPQSSCHNIDALQDATHDALFKSCPLGCYSCHPAWLSHPATSSSPWLLYTAQYGFSLKICSPATYLTSLQLVHCLCSFVVGFADDFMLQCLLPVCFCMSTLWHYCLASL